MPNKIVTYNFCRQDKNEEHKDMINRAMTDTRNGITTVKLIPNMQSYVNYMELLIMYRDKWVSTGYLDLGMIPIITGPSFMHEVLVRELLPKIESSGLIVQPMPATSFLLNSNRTGSTEYWAFRDDVGKYLGCKPEEVTFKAVLEKLIGVEFY